MDGVAVRTYNGDTSVAKATMRLSVAGVDLILGVVFGAVVMGQLDDAFSVEDAVAVGQSFGGVVGEEVEIELGIGELQLLHNGHA